MFMESTKQTKTVWFYFAIILSPPSDCPAPDLISFNLGPLPNILHYITIEEFCEKIHQERLRSLKNLTCRMVSRALCWAGFGPISLVVSSLFSVTTSGHLPTLVLFGVPQGSGLVEQFHLHCRIAFLR